GHMQAAVAAYPELGNLDQPVQVRETWDISEHVLAPTETAFRFVRDVLSQVVDIFPSEWIHIGGDECPTVGWRSSPVAHEFMAAQGPFTDRQIQRESLRGAGGGLAPRGAARGGR